jgi:trans-aconitate methyltransferase
VNASQASLLEIVRALRAAFAAGDRHFSLDVLDPDAGRGHYAGELVTIEGAAYIHRPLRVWVDLAERLGLRLLTPRPIPSGPPLLRLTFEPLARTDMPEQHEPANERYGASSQFARISKLDDPSFVIDMADALARVMPPSDTATPHAKLRILDLGINRGDEVELMLALEPALSAATIVGIDHSASAIEAARTKLGPTMLPGALSFHVADVGDSAALDALALGRFDLVVSIGLFQSGALDDRALLRRIVQDHLAPEGAVILGMPNCRYVDGEIEYGARMKNFTQPELGLVIKDVAFYRKYLQQHHKKVFVTGKHYLLVTAIP